MLALVGAAVAGAILLAVGMDYLGRGLRVLPNVRSRAASFAYQNTCKRLVCTYVYMFVFVRIRVYT